MNAMVDLAWDKSGAWYTTASIVVFTVDALTGPRIASEGRELPPWQKIDEFGYILHPIPFLTRFFMR